MLLEGSCHCGPLPGRVGDALPVSGLLLLHLPQDCRGRRLRHQPYAPPWCEIPTGEDERHFPEYPEEIPQGVAPPPQTRVPLGATRVRSLYLLLGCARFRSEEL